jgi:hypothetical protein
MKSQDRDRGLNEQLAVALRKLLADVPFATLEPALPPGSDIRADWVGKLRLPAGERFIFLEAKSAGQPRLVRDAVNQLLRSSRKYPDALCIVGAPYITPEAASIAVQDGMGYLDLAGNCRLVLDGVYIRREGWPNKFAKRRDLKSLYSPKAERVLRTMLLDPRHQWKIEGLAAAAKVSIGQASNVKRLLGDREWIARQPGGIALTQPAKLLEEWADNYRYSRNTVTDFFSLEPLSKIEEQLAGTAKQLNIEYALGGFSAAARMAPMVRYQRAAAYVKGDIDKIAKRMALKPVSSGANLSLITPYDGGVLAGSQEIDGMRVASAVQTYLDLHGAKGRGQEAAQAIFDGVIKTTW